MKIYADDFLSEYLGKKVLHPNYDGEKITLNFKQAKSIFTFFAQTKSKELESIFSKNVEVVHSIIHELLVRYRKTVLNELMRIQISGDHPDVK